MGWFRTAQAAIVLTVVVGLLITLYAVTKVDIIATPTAVAVSRTVMGRPAATVSNRGADTMVPSTAGETRAVIEAVNNTSIPPGGTITPIQVMRGTPLEVVGWAVDAPNHAPAGGVLLSVDNALIVPATYGFDRPDAAAVLHDPAFSTRIGYTGTLPTAALTPGRHLLVIRVLTQDARAYYPLAQVVELLVT